MSDSSLLSWDELKLLTAMNRYWVRKRKAAHFILGELIPNAPYTPTADINNDERTELYTKTYSTRSIEQLHTASNGEFDLSILRDSTDLLHRKGYVKYSVQNHRNENKSEITTNKEGEFAYLEEYFLMEIRDDKFKRSVNISNAWTPWLTLFIGTITLIRTFVGCDTQTQGINRNDTQILLQQTKELPAAIPTTDSAIKNPVTMQIDTTSNN